MPTNYVSKVSKDGGGVFEFMDKEARSLILDEAEARSQAIEEVNNLADKVVKIEELVSYMTGSVKLDMINFNIEDPDTSTSIGSSIDTEYTIDGTKCMITGNVDVVPGKAQRLWFYCIIETSNFPNGIILNGLYDGTTKISTNIITSYALNGKLITIGYLDISDSSTYTRIIANFGYTFIASGAKITIRKFDVLTTTSEQNKDIQYLDVGTDREFPTFTSAFNWAKGRPFINFGIRFFGDGTDHDISIENGNTDVNGLMVPENVVEIIGVGDRDNNIISDTYNNSVGSCFWIGYGTKIRNIYFKGTGKYCIHIDDPNNKQHNTIIENCRFYHSSGGSGSIGIGFQAMSNITIKDNYFEKDTDAGIRAHNWHYSNQTSGLLNIIGNKFKGNEMAHAIHLYTVANYNYGYPIANIVGNEFDGLDIILSEEDYTSLGVGNHWRVWGHNNSNVDVNIYHHDSADYTNCIEIFLPAATVTDEQV